MEIKNKILKVAYDLFLKYGLRRVSIEDICSEIHISKRTFYTHFKQKEELISQIMELIIEERDKSKANYPSEYNAIDMFMAEYRLHQKKQTQKHVDLFFDLKKYYPEIFTQYSEDSKQKHIEETEVFIQKGIDEGVFRPELHVKAMALLVHVKFGEIFGEFNNRLNIKAGEAFGVLYDALIHMLASEEGLAYYKEQKKNNKQNI